VKVSIETARCQGHGRCYDLAPAVFSEDEEGYGQVVADGAVTVENAAAARRAEANCPEHAITILENG
jgi:ferredoxin